MLRLAVACCAALIVGCSGQVADHADASKAGKDSGRGDASQGRTDGSTDAAAGLVPCDDGTGATDCCPQGSVSGATCAISATSCWTGCDFSMSIAAASQGYRSEMSCTDGHWMAGHGLFPCSRADAAAPLPACSWDKSLFHTDGSTNLCFVARTDTVCTGVRGCTVECLVDDPSQCPGPSDGSSCSSSSGDAGPMTCADTCKRDEYAVECEASGQLGNGPFAVPPAGSACHLDTTAPGSAEAEYYCCPCDK